MFRCNSITGACLSAAILSACINSATSGISPTFPSSNPPNWANLYVANSDNSTITVYKPGSYEPERTISNGITQPLSIAFARSGDLYVSNLFWPRGGCCCHGWVSVYAPGSKSVLRTITQGMGCPGALAFDAAGNLYVANSKTTCSGQVCSSAFSILVYATGSTSLIRTISQGVNWPDALAFDRTGNLYVANEDLFNNGKHGTVTVYAPGSSSILRTIKGLVYASLLAFDAVGNLYVEHGGYPWGINVYAPGSTSILRSIPAAGFDLVLDRAGNLYISLNMGAHFCVPVVVYAAGSTSVLRTISQGLCMPGALALDSAGDLYVANLVPTGIYRSRSNVLVYAAGSTSVVHRITAGVDNPRALAFGP